jgi:hypothetical protein
VGYIQVYKLNSRRKNCIKSNSNCSTKTSAIRTHTQFTVWLGDGVQVVVQLLPTGFNGGKGSNRLTANIESLISDAITTLNAKNYLLLH